MNRRDLLKVAPVALLASGNAAEAAALALGGTPIARLYAEWVAQRGRWLGMVRADDPGEDAEFQKLSAIEDAMMGLPSQNAKDMATKLLVGHGFGDQSCLDFDGPVWAEARALVS